MKADHQKNKKDFAFLKQCQKINANLRKNKKKALFSLKNAGRLTLISKTIKSLCFSPKMPKDTVIPQFQRYGALFFNPSSIVTFC